MKQKIEPLRRAKLPPILEIDEDGLPVFELDTSRHWSEDGETDGVQLGDRPFELDD